MPRREEDFSAWESLWERIGAFSAGLSRNRAHHVNSAGLLQQARDTVKVYFREVKPALHRLGVTDSTLADLDSDMQGLIGLATGRNSKRSYQTLVRTMKSKRKDIETGLEFLIGAPEPQAAQLEMSSAEAAMLRTLKTMLPTAASYEQVLRDVRDAGRQSYRGTAADLREVVREVLDHLAPDADVMNSPGFRLEQDQRSPTMKQKVRFILRARKAGDSTRQTAEDSVQHLDENVAALGRAVYNRGSTDVHTAKALEELLNFKGYADAILAELLAIHKSASAAPATLQEQNEYLKFIANSRAEQLQKAGLPVRFPRLPRKTGP